MPDPLKPPKPSSVERNLRKKARKAGIKAKPEGGQRGRGIVPFETSPEDRVRIKLRDHQRKVRKIDGASHDLTTLPGVHALSFATRYIDGGRDRFIELVQLAVLNNLPSATAWYAVFADLLLTERQIVSFDDVCAAAGVRPAQLMSEVVSCAMEMSRDVGNLVAAMTHPEVVRQAAKSAKRIGGEYAEIGFKDRQMLFQHEGFVPVPKSMQINVNASASAQAAAAAAQEPTVPSFVQDMAALKEARRALPTTPAVDVELIAPDSTDE